jgi:DNA polymerase
MIRSQEQLRTFIVQCMESLSDAGVTHLRRAHRSTSPKRSGPSAGSSQPVLAEPIIREPRDADHQPARDRASMARQLDELSSEVARCTRCQELACNRTQTVFGTGDPQARLCFLGEAPGVEEDRRGEPFVGAAGQLLNKIIQACQLRREDVYILNVLKCRPPDNRTPLPSEAANCRPFLERQLELIQPEFICCLGAVAAQNLLETSTPIGRLRGRFHEYRGSRVVCTYHPAYLLRNPAAKRQTWEDMKLLMQAMGIELP